MLNKELVLNKKKKKLNQTKQSRELNRKFLYLHNYYFVCFRRFKEIPFFCFQMKEKQNKLLILILISALCWQNHAAYKLSSD